MGSHRAYFKANRSDAALVRASIGMARLSL